MAKKTTKVDNGDLKFDSELDLNFDDEFGLLDVTKNKRKRQPIHDVARGLKDATKSRLKSAGFWDNLARKALPRSYTVISDEVKKSQETLADVFRESSRTLKPELSRIGRQIDDLVPEESKRIKRWSKKLNDESSRYTPPSAETLQNQLIGDAQAEIFDKIHQHSDSREARDRAESRIKEKIDTKRFTTSINILAGLHADVARISSYTTSVDAAYKKKSLELQFRSYHVQSETLREMSRNNAITRAYFEAIKENTALPDFAKITKTEMFKQQALAKVFEGVQGGVSGGIKRVGKRLRGYAEEAKGRLGDLSQGLDAASMFRDQMKMAKEMGMDESMYYNAPAMGGGMLVDWLAGKAAPHIGKLFPKGGKASQKMAKAARIMHDPSSLAKSLRDRKGLQERMGAGGLKGIFAQFEHDILGDFITPDRNTTLTSGREAGKLELAHFDHKVHRSITDIIPGYLMRILQETSSIRGGLGYATNESVTYDWKSGKFTNPRKLAKRIKEDIINRPGNDSLNYRLGETAKMFTGNELQGGEALRVKQFIHKLAAKDGFEFTPENILATREFGKLRPEEQALIRKQFTKISKNEENREFFSGHMNDLRSGVDKQTNETMAMLSQLLKDMNPEELERAGLTKENESGGQSINLARIQTLLRKKAVHSTSSKPTEYKRPPPANEAGEHKYVGDIPNWTYDNATKRYNWTSDRNAKTNVRSANPKSLLDRLKGLNLFNYQYRGKHQDGGRQHTGPMAQDVNRQFGDAAPNGTSIDDRAMSAIQTGAIKELNAKVENQIKDETAVGLLKSIDARLAQMTTIGKLSIGFSPADGDRSLFGDTMGLAGRYSKAILKKGREGVGRGSNFIMDTGNFLRDKVANPLWEGTKETWDNNKDQVKDGVSKVFTDLITLSGKAYDKGMDFVTNVVPNSLRSLNNLMKQGFEKTREYLSKPRDFYIPGLESPVLVGEFFSQGLYVDSEGKPILDLEDLKRAKGAIYKKTGEMVVTAEQMAQGLYDRYGNKLKNIATTLSGVASGAIGWASEKFMEGMGRIKDMFGGAGRAGKGFLSGILGGMGSSRNGTLEKILDLLTKWDRNGQMGGDSSLSPSSVLGNLGEIPGDHGGSESSASAPAGQAGSGFSTVGSIVGGAQKLFKSDTFKNGVGRIANSKGMQRLGGLGSMIGGLGGGRVGRMGSGLKGMLGTAAGAFSGLLGGGSSDQSQSSSQTQTATDGQQATPQKEEKRSDVLKNISGMLNRGKAAWNDKDNSGRRDGDFRDRLDTLKEADRNKKTAENIRAPEGHRYSNGGIMGMLKGLFGMLSGGVGKLFSLAGSTLLGLGGVGKLLGGAARGVGSVIKGAGSVAGAGGKLLGKVGGPLAKGIARVGATGVGRAIAGTAARTAIISGAASIMTGGIGSAVLGAVAAGITGLGAVLASPVALGALATGAAAYGGYKLYKYLTRGKVDDFQKFRYMQYGFGSNMADQYYQKLLGLETYFLGGRVGYRPQNGSPNKVAYLLDSKVKSEDVMKAFDVDMNDPEEVEMFTNWIQYRFKPFFLNTLTALFNANPKINLMDAATKLKPEERVKFLEGAKFASSAAYEYSQPPVKSVDGYLPSYKSEVLNIIDGLIKGDDSKGKSGQSGAEGKSLTENLMDKAKTAAGYAIPGLGAVKLGKDLLSGVKDSKVVSAASSMMSNAARGTVDTTKELLKFLKDKDIPVSMKQTILGLGTSVMGSLPGVGNTLMKAAMVALGPGALIMEGAKKILNSKTAQSLKTGIENIYQSTKDAVAPVIDTAKEKFSNAVSAGKSFMGRAASFATQSFDSAKSFVSKNYDKLLGFISSKYESGRKGVSTISTGQGDAGGVSYGRYQLASKNGSMTAFLSSPEGAKYAGQFQGLNPGSPQFNAKYAEIANIDAEGFDKAQHEYIARTHYDQAFNKLQSAIPGLNLGKRSRAVQEAIFSTSVQYGPHSNVLINALKDKDISNMTDEQIVSAIQDYKSQNVDSQFRSSSPAVRQSVSQRIMNEKMDLIALARASNDSPGVVKTSAIQISDKLDAGLTKTAASPASNDAAYSAVSPTALNHSLNGKHALGISAAGVAANDADESSNLVKTSATGQAVASPTDGDPSSAMAMTKTSTKSKVSEIAATSPTLSSKRLGSKRDDSGGNAMSELIEAAMSSNNIQSQQLNAMIEIRDLIKGIDEYVRARDSKKSSATVPVQRPRTPKAEPVEPIVDIRRKRSA